MRLLVFVTLLAALLLGLEWPSLACIHPPRTYEGSIGSQAQEAILLYADGQEELILKVDYAAGGGALESFGWVITVPNEPERYEVADPKLFKDVFQWAQRYEPVQRNAPWNAEAEDAPNPQHALEMGKRVQVGPFDIQPVRGRGQAAAKGLNDWLTKNGFAALEEKSTAWFVERNFTFLCVKVVPGEGQKALGASGALPPLQLSFKTEKPYFPLKLSATQGAFELNLYTLTRGNLDFKASEALLKKVGWGGAYQDHLRQNTEVRRKDYPRTLEDAVAKSAFKDDQADWKLNRIHIAPVNKDGALKDWNGEFFLEPAAAR
ncbi:MAG: DUF2330 domain-containing protein [Planctomycetota bacterium]|nr:DUF2330 domain-containing protein [Planctomycetota bacterium]